MKVITLISGGDIGGAKTHVLSLLHGLGKTEQVRLVCFREGEFAEDARKLGIDTCVMEVSVGAAIGRLTQMIRKEGFQIIHCHGARANLTGAILRRKVRVPIVTTVHSDYRLDYLGRPLHRLTYGTINTIALRMFDYHIGVSDAMAQLLISRGFDPQTMFAIYNGIDFTPVTPKLGREDYLRSVGLEVQDDTVVFGIAARLDPVKDMPTLIRGFSIAVKDHPNIRLLIAGEGEQHQMLEALAAQTCPPGTVVFAGWVTDMDSFYHALDVNTLTSISETFPYAITEGARMRCATIASNVGGIPYIIEHGVTGLLFEPQNAEALGACMTRLAESRAMREQLGENLYEKPRTNSPSTRPSASRSRSTRPSCAEPRSRRRKIRRAHLRCLRQGQRRRRCDPEGHSRAAQGHRPGYAHLCHVARPGADEAVLSRRLGACVRPVRVLAAHAEGEAVRLRRRQSHPE